MPSTIKFFGASVLSINTNIGWGGSGSELKIDLVEDLSAGDVFTPSIVGGPATLILGSLSFRGLLKKYTQDKSPNGYPKYSVFLSDSRHLLDDCKIIVSDYRLSTTGIYNLFNIFGYYENIGYGASNTNSTGMPWTYVRDGLHAICNGAFGAFGGPITYRGFNYRLNLSDLPALPAYFRVGGHSAGLSISDFIQICCDAANHDYFIRLEGMTITLHTVPRLNAYPLGTISTMISSTFAGTVLRSNVGVEERAETTSTFIIGENVHTLNKISSLADFEDSFWGFNPVTSNESDVNNLRPIIGSVDGTYVFANFYAKDTTVDPPEDNTSIYSYPIKRYRLYIDSPTVAGIVGSTTWITNDLELQVILGLGQHSKNFQSWTRYLYRTFNALYQQIALNNVAPDHIQPPGPNFFGIPIPFLPNNNVQLGRPAIDANQATINNNLSQSGTARLKIVYDFLSIYARSYYGKKFALRIPGVARKLDTDSGKVSYSHEVTDGGWVDATDVSNDLSGLPPEAYLKFQTQDGRFQSFCKFDATNVDISRVNKVNTFQSASGSNHLFSKININPQMYFDLANNAYVVADVEPVYNYPDSIVGYSGVVGPLMLATGIFIQAYDNPPSVLGRLALRDMVRNRTQGPIPHVMHPKPICPYEFQVPIKSNVLTYGPWYAQGAAGKINYEQDTTLAPWNYGGFTNLNLAGFGKANDAISNIQVIETGSIEVAGLPLYNIGDLIEASGPNITSISVDLQKEFTTTYRFETYVPRPGQLGKYNRDAIVRNRIASVEMSRKIQSRAELAIVANAGAENAAAGNLAFQRLLGPAIFQESPSNMLVSKLVEEEDGGKYHIVSTATLGEVAGLIPSDDTEYKGVAATSLEAIISPYAIFDSTNTSMAQQETTGGLSQVAGIQNALTLSPWKDCLAGYTTKYYTKNEGAGYVDLNDYNWETNPASSSVAKQVFGIKGPLVIVGWGFDLTGQIVPADDYLTDATLHKAGPIDPLWDNYRKVWSVNNNLIGVTDEVCGKASKDEDDVVDGFNYCTVSIYRDAVYAGFKLNAYNLTNRDIEEGSWVQITYVPTSNKWYIVGNATGDTTINYPGEPDYEGDVGEQVFNTADNTLYIFNGTYWYKFCPCEEDILPAYKEGGQLYIQGDNTEVITYIDSDSGSDGSGTGQLRIQGVNVEYTILIDNPPMPPLYLDDGGLGQLYIQGDNDEQTNVDDGNNSGTSGSGIGQLYIQALNVEEINGDVFVEGGVDCSSATLLTTGTSYQFIIPASTDVWFTCPIATSVESVINITSTGNPSFTTYGVDCSDLEPEFSGSGTVDTGTGPGHAGPNWYLYCQGEAVETTQTIIITLI